MKEICQLCGDNTYKGGDLLYACDNIYCTMDRRMLWLGCHEVKKQSEKQRREEYKQANPVLVFDEDNNIPITRRFRTDNNSKYCYICMKVFKGYANKHYCSNKCKDKAEAILLLKSNYPEIRIKEIKRENSRFLKLRSDCLNIT